MATSIKAVEGEWNQHKSSRDKASGLHNATSSRDLNVVPLPPFRSWGNTTTMQLFWWINTLQIPSAFILLSASYLHYWLDYTIHRFDPPPPLGDYDFIVVGAGSAGSVIASRLSESGRHSVLLIEAGGHPSFISSIPLMSAILGSTPLNWDYRTVPQSYGCESSRNQRSYWPRGKVLGGSSILNFMLYVRGNRLDYDNWAQQNPGWTYSQVLPYFKKAENNRGTRIDEAYHGFSGPLTVEDRRWTSNLPDAFIEAGTQLGYDRVDINGADQIGFTTPQVTTRDGQRGSTYLTYLKEAQKRPHLHVLTYALVDKVLIDRSLRAYGIQYTKNGQSSVVRAKKEIILSAGSIGTPQILMLSGIGPEKHLTSLGIPVLVDRPVGHNLQDHIVVPYGPLIHNDTTASLVHPLDLMAWWDYFKHGKGQYTTNGIDGMAFMATNYSQRSDWPDIQLHFAGYSFATDGGICVKDCIGMDDDVWKQFYGPVAKRNTASILVTLTRPESRGRIWLHSINPADHPLIDPNYYSHPADARVMMEGLKMARKVVQTPAMRKYQMTLSEVPHPSCKEYQIDSDPYLNCLIKHTSITLYHPVGTCKMGPRNDSTAVVDHQLRVHGVRRLRVADASIMPQITTGNTNAPVIMIGEKLADLLLKKWDATEGDSSFCYATEDQCHRSTFI